MNKQKIKTLQSALKILRDAFHDDDAYDDAIDSEIMPDTCAKTLEDIIVYLQNKETK